MTTIRTQRGLLFALALLIIATTPGPADAKEWNWPRDWSQPVHIHSSRDPSFAFRNDVNENAQTQTQTEYARAEWTNNGAYTQYGDHVNLYNVAAWNGQGIHAMDAHYGRIDWVGLSVGNCPCDTVAGHVAYFDVLLNLTYLTDPNTKWGTWESKKATACQEIGHALAIGHGPSSYMGWGYFECTPEKLRDGVACTDIYKTSGRSPEAEDFAHIAHWFGERH